MEQIKKVESFEIDFKCPKCEIGFMRATGESLLCFPPKYTHVCNYSECRHVETFTKTYPYIKHMAV